MIRRSGTYEVSHRENMRGGKGTVVIEHFWKADELKSNTRLFAKLILQPGTSIGLHRHDNEEEVFVVLRGKGCIEEEGGATEVLPGDTIRTGDGASHGVESIGEEPLELLAVIMQY